MRNLFPFFLALLVVLSACATAQDAGAPDAASLPDYLQAQVDSAQAGGSAQVYATQAALYQATVTLATAYAVATSDVRKTAQAQETRVAASKTEQASASATADHKAAVAKTEDANARATMDAKTAIAKTEEAHARSTDIALRHEASTAQANASETAQAHVNATATWVAGAPTRILIAQIQANEDAARQAAQAENEARVAMNLQLAPYRAAWDMFAGPVFLSVLVLVLLAGLWLVLRAGARYLTARAKEREGDALQKLVVLDKNGMPRGFIEHVGRGTYVLEPLYPPALPEAEPVAGAIEAPVSVDTTAPDTSDDLYRVRTVNGADYQSKETPEENARAVRKMLALRLLRDAMQYYARRNETARNGRIPSFRELEWSSESWVRAVDSLKPYVLTKSGRGGGTFCAPEYPNIVLLYDAVGQGKVVPHASETPNAAQVVPVAAAA